MEINLQNYIAQSRQQGMTDDQIRQNLLGAGWKEEQVNQVLGSFTDHNQPLGSSDKVPSPQPETFKKIIKNLCYILGPLLFLIFWLVGYKALAVISLILWAIGLIHDLLAKRNDKSLPVLSLTLGAIFFLFELYLFYYYIYYISPPGAQPLPGISSVDGDSKGWGAIIISFVMAVVSMLSLLNSIWLRKGPFKKIGTVLFIISILCLPVIFQIIAGGIGKVVWKGATAQEEIRIGQRQATEQVQYQKDAEISRQNYSKWQAKFEQPQKLTSITPVSGLFATLEDGTVIHLYTDNKLVSTPLELKDFVEKELVGKEVNIKLPDYRFSKDDFPMGDDAGKDTRRAVRVLVFLADGTLLQLKFPDIVGDYVPGESSPNGPNSMRIHNELIVELQDYQNRKPFFNK